MSPSLWWPDGYTPPAPAIRRCPCGALVMKETWSPVHGWRDLPQVKSPVRGKDHTCRKEVETQATED